MSPVYQPPTSGSGSVATDVIWDTKGDLAAATGADAAVKVPVGGTNGMVLAVDSTQSTGMGWQVPIGGLVDYVEITADVAISATTEATANTVVTGNGFTPNGMDSFWIEFFTPSVATGVTASSQIQIVIYDNGSAITNSMLAQVFSGSSSTGIQMPVLAKRRLTPTNAAHTYSIRASRVTSNGSIRAVAGTYMPAYLAIYRAS